ncbi:Pathogen-associated molecular patterns-induced protein A70 [Linum grandiflorum]
MWTSVAELVTPSSLFLLLNLTIVAIALTSRRNNQSLEIESSQHQIGLDRVPSLLERVRSVNLYSIYSFSSSLSEIETTLPTTPRASSSSSSSFIFKSTNNRSSSPLSRDPVRPRDEKVLVKRIKSETAMVGEGELVRKKMRKSASEKCVGEMALTTVAAKEEEDKIMEKRRPATVRLQKAISIGDDHGGVDSKADDFINRFKQQLKLQRVDSLLRRKQLLKARAL